MAFKQMIIERIDSKDGRVLFYGNDPAFYVIANRGDVITIKEGDTITYEQSTPRYGYYVKNSNPE